MSWGLERASDRFEAVREAVARTISARTDVRLPRIVHRVEHKREVVIVVGRFLRDATPRTFESFAST
jgi:ribosomal protein L18E